MAGLLIEFKSMKIMFEEAEPYLCFIQVDPASFKIKNDRFSKRKSKYEDMVVRRS